MVFYLHIAQERDAILCNFIGGPSNLKVSLKPLKSVGYIKGVVQGSISFFIHLINLLINVIVRAIFKKINRRLRYLLKAGKNFKRHRYLFANVVATTKMHKFYLDNLL